MGNAYNNSSKKVCVNCKRITFDLMPYCRQNEDLHVEYRQVNFSGKDTSFGVNAVTL